MMIALLLQPNKDTMSKNGKREMLKPLNNRKQSIAQQRDLKLINPALKEFTLIKILIEINQLIKIPN